jgi:hypothetical protein
MKIQWIHVMIDSPPDLAESSARFWEAALGWSLGDPWRQHPEYRTFDPPDGDSYIAFQTLQEGQPRVHLDVAVDDPDAVAEHLTAIGAEPGAALGHWQVMTSPGGMPFCLFKHADGKRAPRAVEWGGGHRSRLVQMCVDSPPALHDAEVAFWQAATHWRWAPSDADEFAGKLHPEPGNPVQLLFQRLGDDDPGTSVRVHVDLGSDDVDAEVDRLVRAGARRLWPGRGWYALEDPAGVPFCATGNPP